ncbi:MAG: Gfo/Idh/MocA family oxidoreductase [Planctomycetes bacterium]|nr:Gfo/Idh/MocA family oxidoreductase [Planctomycetota bacterium]
MEPRTLPVSPPQRRPTLSQSTSSDASRRDFLKVSAVAGASLTALAVAPAVHAAGGDTLKIGLIGCGNRGTGAATQALNADKNVKLVAMADAFSDRLQSSLNTLKNDADIAAKIDVKQECCFTGFNAYKALLESGVDVVLLCTPPHFRPLHLQAAIDAGKHIFAEKPVAVDAPGIHKILDACAEAKKKNLSIVSGFCWRYHHGMRDTMKRVHHGDIGDLVAIHTQYNTGSLWHRSLKEKADMGWSDMEWQLRNWLYFTWLSGDHIVEQHVHSLDKMAWALKNEYPVKAIGTGGRQVRTAPDFGHIFDHHAVVFEYANGLKLFSYCRQQAGCTNDVSDTLIGTRGICHINANGPGAATITGANRWQLRPRRDDNMYQNEHDELFASIRAGRAINNGDWMARSSLMAIMGRMATYTGKVITWDMALHSKEELKPEKYEFGPLPMPAVAKPGVTKFA